MTHRKSPIWRLFALTGISAMLAAAFASAEPSAQSPEKRLRDLGLSADVAGRVWLDVNSESHSQDAGGVALREYDVYFLTQFEVQTPSGVMTGQKLRLRVVCTPVRFAVPLALSILGPEGMTVAGPTPVPEQRYIGYEGDLLTTAFGRVMLVTCTMPAQLPEPIYVSGLSEAIRKSREPSSFADPLVN